MSVNNESNEIKSTEMEPNTDSIAASISWVLAFAGVFGAFVLMMLMRQEKLEMVKQLYQGLALNCMISSAVFVVIALIAADAKRASVYARLAWEAATARDKPAA